MYRDMAENMVRELTRAVQEVQAGFRTSTAFLEELHTTLTQIEGVWKNASAPAAIPGADISLDRGELRILYGKRPVRNSMETVQGPMLFLAPSGSGKVTVKQMSGWTKPNASHTEISQDIPCEMEQGIRVILDFLQTSELAYHNLA